MDEWGAFLGRVIPDSATTIFLQKALGYSLTGLGTEEVLFHVSGPTATGKSTFISAIHSALGDYAASANFETFLQQSNKGGPRSDLVRLAGKRFVASMETEEGSRLAVGLLKWITGQDTAPTVASLAPNGHIHPPGANDRPVAGTPRHERKLKWVFQSITQPLTDVGESV